MNDIGGRRKKKKTWRVMVRRTKSSRYPTATPVLRATHTAQHTLITASRPWTYCIVRKARQSAG